MTPRCYPYVPIDLPYSLSGLSPRIDEETLSLHYEVLYKGYITRLNAALKNCRKLWSVPLECMLKNPSMIPCGIRTDVVRNGGGAVNHEIYFSGMTDRQKEPSAYTASRLESCFGSVEKWCDDIKECGKKVFGSGYAVLCSDCRGNLKNIMIRNQDTSYLKTLFPVLAVDVWEHAYLLQYKSDRGGYLDAWTGLIDWDFAEKRIGQTGEYFS